MFVAFVESWFDDYKRPEGSVHIVGCFSTEAKARKAALRAEITGNIAQSDEGHEAFDAYAAFLEEPEITKEIFEKAAEVREEFLGEALCTMMSSGYRASVSKCSLDDEASFYSGYWSNKMQDFHRTMERRKDQTKSSVTTSTSSKKPKKV